MQAGIVGTHDILLVTISILIAIVSSFVAFSTVSRIAKATYARARYLWSTLFGISFGVGVWGMHFVGMLAYQLPLKVSYDLGLTILSLLFVVIASGFTGLFITKNKSIRGLRLVLLATILGLSIASMHYVGMAAMVVHATMHHEHWIMLASVVIAIVVSGVGLYLLEEVKLTYTFAQLRYKIPVAMLMGCAISSMHYTAMAGVSFAPAEGANIMHAGLQQGSLAIFILIVLFLIEAGVLIVSLMDETISSVKAKLLAEEHSKRLASVIEHADELVIVTDVEGVITYVNPAFESASGFSAEETIGETLALVLGDEEGLKKHQEILKELELGKPVLSILSNKAKNSNLYEVAQNAFPLYDNNDCINGFAIIQRDITLQKKVEKKLHHADRVSSLGVLAGGIAHDFNNILTAILGNASLAVKKVHADEPVYKHIDNIVQASHSAADLCRQMLAYSGKGKFVVEPINFSSLVRNMTKLIEVSIPKRVALHYEMPDKLSLIDADAAQLQQVVLNLLTNAAEAMDGKEGRITLVTGEMYADADYLLGAYGDAEKNEGDYVFLEVSDTGCGMSKEVQRQMFDPFFTTKFAGRGLGMSAMLGIVNGHQGALRVYSEEDKGTTFKLIFPVSSATEEKKIKPTEARLNNASGLVLVIDDEEFICETACAMLEDMGYSVVTALGGKQGVEVFKEHQDNIQFVLLDMTMPDMDGKECFRLLRVIKPDVQVILSSGYNEQEATSQFVGRGLAGFIQKPYSEHVLSEKVQLFIQS
ncbi:MAG: MHYT domain-containing protein [Ghiorsea sp.]|nr:MHYT domain-containing protein [Ghiorsea sp.]